MSLPAIQPIPPILTLDEAAAVLRCPTATVRRYIHTHVLPAVQIGKEARIRGEDLLDFVAARPVTTRGGKKH